MRQTIVTAGQSLVDVCLQELGSLAALFDLADANDLAITDLLTPGQRLIIPEASQLAAPEVASYYAARAYRVNVPDPMRPGAGQPPVLPVLHDFLPADVKRSDFY